MAFESYKKQCPVRNQFILTAADEPIDLFVVSELPECWEVLESLDPTRFKVVRVVPLEQFLEFDGMERAPRVILFLADAVPEARALQGLLDAGALYEAPVICVLRASRLHIVAQLLAMGIQEVVALDEVEMKHFHRVAVASIVRDQCRLQLRRMSEQTELSFDTVAGVAGASSRTRILEIFADGLMALGAVGVEVWGSFEGGATLLAERGIPTEAPRGGIIDRDANHPVMTHIEKGVSGWYERVAEVARVFPDYFPPLFQGALGFLPLTLDAAQVTVFVVAYDQLPDGDTLAVLRRLSDQVGAALRRAETEMRLVLERDAYRRLLGIVSHDLRNPLNTISMATSVLEEEIPIHVERSMVKHISRSTHSAIALTQDLLTFAKGSLGNIELSPQRLDVFPLVASCVEDANLRATDQRQVQWEQGEGQGETWADAMRIEQVLGNLLSNALTYSAAGSTVVVRGTADSHAIYLEVENRGSRLDTKDIAKIFEPMTRLSEVAEHGSMGLGLFIVSRILEAHHGRVWVEQGKPDGVRFCLQLPRYTERPKVPFTMSLETRPSWQHRPTSTDASMDESLSRLLNTIRSKDMVSVLQAWAAARTNGPLPHPLAIDRSSLLAYLPHMVMTSIAFDEKGEPLFAWNDVGPALERRLGKTLIGEQLAPVSSDAASHYAAYHQCWQFKRCTYDYVRIRGKHPVQFERLLMPLSRDGGRSVTNIMGLIWFSS